jgi:purine-binding chemotaxis protein CheW
MPKSGTAAGERCAEKFLAFHVGAEEFAIGVLSVREIMGMQDITAVPQTPGYVKGIINLRGKVVPVVDLRLKFGMMSEDYTQRTCIVVVEVTGENSRRLVGVVVDAVSEVLNLSPSDIENTPDFGEGVNIPLDIDRVLTASELCRLDAMLN